MRDAYWGGGILLKIASKFFPTCNDFKTTTNSISSKCKLSTSSTTRFILCSLIGSLIVDTRVLKMYNALRVLRPDYVLLLRDRHIDRSIFSQSKVLNILHV